MVPVMTSMPGHSHKGPLPPLDPGEIVIRDNLKAHVSMLAGTIGQRNVFYFQKLNAAADYIKQKLTDTGYAITEQKFEVNGKQVSNIIIEISSKNSSGEIIIVGAHY